MSESANRVTLAREYSERHEVSLVEAKAIVDNMAKLMASELSAGKEIYLRGLGSFRILLRKGRIVRNQKNFAGSDYLPPFKAVKFKPSNVIKNKLKKQ
jgi:nucleoid DNA-binding protein